MRDYKKRAERILERRDTVLAKRNRRKKALCKYTVPAAALCSVAAVCIGAVLWDSSVNNTPSDMISYIQSRRSADSEAVTSASSFAAEITTETTVTSVSLTESTANTETDSFTGYSYDTDYQQPAVTHTTAVTAETAKTSETTVTQTTEPMTEPIEDTTIEMTMPRLAAWDDPIWVFSNINYDGVDYVGCRYINQYDIKSFYKAWREDSELTTFDTKKGHEVTEPVTVYGLSSKDEVQDYIIVSFNSYGINALYESAEEQPYEPYVPEYEDEEEENEGEEETPTEDKTIENE